MTFGGPKYEITLSIKTLATSSAFANSSADNIINFVDGLNYELGKWPPKLLFTKGDRSRTRIKDGEGGSGSATPAAAGAAERARSIAVGAALFSACSRP